MKKNIVRNNIWKTLKYFNFKTLKSKPLLIKVLFTIAVIILYRIAATITIPGVIVKSGFAEDSNSFLGIINMLGGGGLSRLSIVALGISPFITASIIMQLFQSEAFPPLYRLAKSGPRGKRKINVITRTLTFIFAVMQAITLISQMTTNSTLISMHPDYNDDIYRFFILPFILVGGSMFALFLGEQITNRGVGNGTSLIIFSGIAASLPDKFKDAFYYLGHEYIPEVRSSLGYDIALARHMAYINFFIYFAAFWFLVFIIGYVYKSERHIPIQQTGAGMTIDAKQMSRLPMKVNPSGVMPIIFPMMLLSIPNYIVQFFDEDNAGRVWVLEHLKLTAPLGMILLIALIMLFSIGFSVITFNPTQISDNFKKQGTFIPGIRPGLETEEYLTSIVLRMSVFSGVYLSLISIVKYIQEIILMNKTGFSNAEVSRISFGGTSVLILVSVAIETLEQLKARDTTHKISKSNRLARNKGQNKVMEGLLW